MMINRRQFSRLLPASALAPLAPRVAFAAGYPDRPVHIINPTAPGGTNDVVARLVGQALSDRLGQPFIIDDKPGAGANVAADFVLRAPADGYTIFAISKGSAFANMLYKNPGYDFMRDFRPITPGAIAPLVMLVNPSVPVKSVPEFLAYARANPGKINYGSAGVGSDPHLASELLKLSTGIDMTHVPFRGGALALTDLMAGGIQLMFSNLPVADYMREGKLRGLAVTTAKRSPSYPDLPALAEYVEGFDDGVWVGFVARKDTPTDIIEKLNSEIVAGLANPKVLEGLKVLNATPMPMSTAEMGKLLDTELERWGKVFKAAKIEPE